jgi:membrane protease YdiL (CAAX protease family)
MNRSRILVFVAIAYGISWTCWLPIVKLVHLNPFESPALVILLFLVGVYSPTISAIINSAIIGGWPAVKDLLKKCILWRVGIIWYAFAILFMPLAYSLSVFAYTILDGSVGSVNYGMLPIIPVAALLMLFLGPLGEESGWRGFALPYLERKYGYIICSVVIGLIWAFWHTPLFWAKSGTLISGYPVTFLSVTKFLLFATGLSFIFTWLYINTNGSVLLAILLHHSVNMSGMIVSLLFPDLELDGKQKIDYFFIIFIWMLIICGLGFNFYNNIASKRQIRT